MHPCSFPDDPTGGPARLVCRCVGVSSARIVAAARTQNLTELAQVQQATRAGTGCGTCHPEICEILDELAGRPMPEADRRLSLQLCQSETHCRVEAALYNGVVPKLERGTEVDLVAVEGLTVDVHLLHNDRQDVREFIVEKLRKLVCGDLNVVFS